MLRQQITCMCHTLIIKSVGEILYGVTTQKLTIGLNRKSAFWGEFLVTIRSEDLSR